MPPKKWSMTKTEVRLKRQRLVSAFLAGKAALDELKLPFFLANTTAISALRSAEFRPAEDEINIAIFAWDLAELQRSCGRGKGFSRDSRLLDSFNKKGFTPVKEAIEVEDGAVEECSACPRFFIIEGWSEEQAYPVVYKFVHSDSYTKFNITIWNMDFSFLWDFADGGAESSSGWRYTPFTPQPISFEKEKVQTMPPSALQERYGPEWITLRTSKPYLAMLADCHNRCELLRIQPFTSELEPPALPPAVAEADFLGQVQRIRADYAKAIGQEAQELPPMALDVSRIEWRPSLLLQGAGLCIVDGNALIKNGKMKKALDTYSEGLYMLSKLREVLSVWRQSEVARKATAEKKASFSAVDPLQLLKEDMDSEERLRLNLHLNAAQAALHLELWDLAETHASAALEMDPSNVKGLYRRGLARSHKGRSELAKHDFFGMLKHTAFQSQEALNQLLKLMPKEQLQREVHERRTVAEKNSEFRRVFLEELEEDPRIEEQEERYNRFQADLEQRKLDKQAAITFDQWALQYEWRYDGEERQKVRARWPFFFSHLGPAPLPVEDWEVDYLTLKAIDAINYHRETKAILAGKPEKAPALEEPETAQPAVPPGDGFHYKLEVDEEDLEIFQSIGSNVIKKGYNYWVLDQEQEEAAQLTKQEKHEAARAYEAEAAKQSAANARQKAAEAAKQKAEEAAARKAAEEWAKVAEVGVELPAHVVPRLLAAVVDRMREAASPGARPEDLHDARMKELQSWGLHHEDDLDRCIATLAADDAFAQATLRLYSEFAAKARQR